MENKCPSCHSTNIRNDSVRNDNGIIGPGYKSWLVEEKYSCNECGVYFRPLTKKDLNLAVIGHGKPAMNHDNIIANQLTGMSLEEAIFQHGYSSGHDVGYERGKREATGPRWVKASEFKTTEPVYRPYRRKRDDEEIDYDYGEIYITEDSGDIFFDVDNEHSYEPQTAERWKDFEILDESTPAGREEDAVAFLAWIQNNDYYYSTHGGGYWYEWNEKEQETFLCNTNDELYELFKQQKEGK